MSGVTHRVIIHKKKIKKYYSNYQTDLLILIEIM